MHLGFKHQVEEEKGQEETREVAEGHEDHKSLSHTHDNHARYRKKEKRLGSRQLFKKIAESSV